MVRQRYTPAYEERHLRVAPVLYVYMPAGGGQRSPSGESRSPCRSPSQVFEIVCLRLSMREASVFVLRGCRHGDAEESSRRSQLEAGKHGRGGLKTKSEKETWTQLTP